MRSTKEHFFKFTYSFRLNDPTLYCTVMDAKAGVVGVGAGAEVEEELYTAPIYNEPAPVKNT